MTNNEKTIEERFKELVECAEKYIWKNAKDVLIALRLSELNLIDKNEDIIKFLNKFLDSEYIKKELSFLDNKTIITKVVEKFKEINSVKELLINYQPLCKDLSEINFDIILERFCVELQNYQAMPKAINYASYNNKETIDDTDVDANSNKIFQIAIKFYHNLSGNVQIPETKENEIPSYYFELYKKFKEEKELKFEENKKYLEFDTVKNKWYKKAQKNKNEMKKYVHIDNLESIFDLDKDKGVLKYNYAWCKYSQGLMDVLIKLKNKIDYVDYIKEICKQSDKYFDNKDRDKKFKELTKMIKIFHENIFGISDTLSYDFLKELHCKNLIKDDVHILECYKHCINQDAKIKNKNERENIVKDFLELCNKHEQTPYYIDKILWLCCTGNFYEDGIIINKMNRTKFFEYYDNNFT